MRKLCILLLLTCLPGLALAQTDLYLVKSGQLPYAGRTQASVNVVIESPVNEARDFFQSFMKETYRLPFRGGLGGLLGKNSLLTVKQAPGTAISSRAVDLYAAFTALTDSTTEVAVFGGYGEKTFFSPDLTSLEFKRMQALLEKFAPAARANAYRQRIADAEAKVAAIDKEKDKLNKAMQAARDNTTSNLRRIEDLLRQNQNNAQLLRQDSTQLVGNAQLREASQAQLERRRARLTIVDPK